MREEELSKAMENFKIIELDSRLEMGKWSASTDTTHAVDENATYTIPF